MSSPGEVRLSEPPTCVACDGAAVPKASARPSRARRAMRFISASLVRNYFKGKASIPRIEKGNQDESAFFLLQNVFLSCAAWNECACMDFF